MTATPKEFYFIFFLRRDNSFVVLIAFLGPLVLSSFVLAVRRRATAGAANPARQRARYFSEPGSPI